MLLGAPGIATRNNRVTFVQLGETLEESFLHRLQLLQNRRGAGSMAALGLHSSDEESSFLLLVTSATLVVTGALLVVTKSY